MKVIHVLKKIEQVDDDIKELRKMEKALQRNKSFSNPIFMTIEKQINILLGERIKLLELNIANPPEALAKEFDGAKSTEVVKPLRKGGAKGDSKKKTEKASVKSKPVKEKSPAASKSKERDFDDDEEIPMLTQDMIDSKFGAVKKIESAKKDDTRPLLVKHEEEDDDDNDDSVKLLDIALQKGTLNKDEIDKEKKRVRFFRDNFPGGEY
ncbi:MAG TPA: hypothetical protein PKK43_00745 [Spirochaetota bacterium]|nr:hypothetical protein [Spirochaetota bacterium]